MAQAGMLAGYVSALAYIVHKDAVGGVKRDNIQTIDLPQAAMNLNPVGRGGGDISILDDSALLPQDGPMGTPVEIEESAKSSQISTYVVRKGDTLSSIAEMFDVSVNTIMWANNIRSSRDIKPGDQLVILPVTGIRYTVKTGGTLRDIVKKNGGDIDEAALYNGVDPDEELKAGTVVIVPDAELVQEAPKQPTRTNVAKTKTPTPNYSGYYRVPLANYTRTQGVHGYNGVDLASFMGAPVMASAAGEVIIAKESGYNGGYGKYVVIRHDNGTQTLYAHAQALNVRVGQRVGQGETIAFLGNSGRSTGPHLHFEIRGAKNPF